MINIMTCYIYLAIDGFLNQVGGNFPRQWAYFNMADLYNFYQSLDPEAAEKLIAKPDLGGSFSVTEDVVDIYLQANFEGELLGQYYYLNVGGRYVDTQVEATGYSQKVDKIIRDENGYPVDTTYQELEPINKKNSYGYFLPSLNFKWEIADDYVVRVAASKVLSRPSLSQMSPYESVSSTGPLLEDNKKRVSNPALKPFTARQFDTSFEWYFSEFGAATVAFYYKDIENFVSTEVFIEEIDGYEFEVTMPVNNKDSSIIKGIEVGYQQSLDDILPDYLAGFGFQANYTYSDTDSGKENAQGEKVGFIGMSKNSYNLQAFYENGAFSTRFAYNYRDEFLSDIHNSEWGYDLYTDAAGFLDWSLSYDISDNLILRTSINNITDEGTRQYRGDTSRMAFQAFWGRTITLGITGRF